MHPRLQLHSLSPPPFHPNPPPYTQRAHLEGQSKGKMGRAFLVTTARMTSLSLSCLNTFSPVNISHMSTPNAYTSDDGSSWPAATATRRAHTLKRHACTRLAGAPLRCVGRPPTRACKMHTGVRGPADSPPCCRALHACACRGPRVYVMDCMRGLGKHALSRRAPLYGMNCAHHIKHTRPPPTGHTGWPALGHLAHAHRSSCI